MQITRFMKQKSKRDPYITRSILKAEFEEFKKRFEKKLDVRFSAIDLQFSDFKTQFSDLKQLMWDSHSRSEVLLEDIRHEMRAIGEGFNSHVSKLENHEKRLETIETDLPLLKLAITKR